ncbi:hypothetical protein VNO78_16272 [Psophocarpus tetragonolobus]|uniref:Uncharacterized protein n=1 Tax=Psophocarpus tetragonolobus TaxID=3891 RepID=A0AAN9SGE6_PSOTE
MPEVTTSVVPTSATQSPVAVVLTFSASRSGSDGVPQEQVASLNHYSVTPEVSSLWNAKLTSTQMIPDNRLLSKEDRGSNYLEGEARKGIADKEVDWWGTPISLNGHACHDLWFCYARMAQPLLLPDLVFGDVESLEGNPIKYIRRAALVYQDSQSAICNCIDDLYSWQRNACLYVVIGVVDAFVEFDRQGPPSSGQGVVEDPFHKGVPPICCLSGCANDALTDSWFLAMVTDSDGQDSTWARGVGRPHAS